MDKTILEALDSKVVVKAKLHDLVQRIEALEKEVEKFKEDHYSDIGSKFSRVVSGAEAKLGASANELEYVYDEM